MDTWRIVKAALEHCMGAIAVGGLFALTGYLFTMLFPGDAVTWWVNKIEFVLGILTATGLAVIFLSSLGRIVYDALVSMWKGGPNVHTQSLLA